MSSVDRSAIRERLRTIPVTLDGGATIEVKIRLSAITLDLQEDFEKQRAEEGDLAATVSMLERVMAEWNVTDAGKPVPITKDELLTFDPMFLGAISDEVARNISPNGKTSAG